ncbi:MFS transporter [Phenylobacterium sp.]|uniref:MFS transporter n=1 Tax=Phenylobacterium sp. TaxID=1871053 RepID=UPI00301DD534
MHAGDSVSGAWWNEFRQGWTVLLAATVGAALSASSFASFTLGFFMPRLQAEYGWDRSAIGAAASAFLMGLLVLMPLAGRFADRWGARRVALGSIVIAALTLAAASQAITSLWSLYAAYAALAVGGAGTSFVVYSRAVNSWFVRSRGLALGIMIAGTGISTAVMPFLLPPIIAAYGWRSGYLLLALAVLVALVAVVPLLRERTVATQDVRPAEGMTMREIRRTPAFWTLAFAILCISPVFAGVTIHLAPAYTDMGATPLQIQAAVSAFGISMMIARPLIGLALDRFPAPLVAATALMAPAITLALAGRSGPEFAVVVGVALGIGLSAESDMMAYIVSRYFGLKAYSEAYGWLYSFATFGFALGPIMAGWVYEAFGDYDVGLMTAAGLCVLGALAFLSLTLRGPRAHATAVVG